MKKLNNFNTIYENIKKDLNEKPIVNEGLLGTFGNKIGNALHRINNFGSEKSKQENKGKMLSRLKTLFTGSGFKQSAKNPNKYIGDIEGERECFKYVSQDQKLYGYHGVSGELKFVAKIDLSIAADEETIQKAVNKICEKGGMPAPTFKYKEDQDKETAAAEERAAKEEDEKSESDE